MADTRPSFESINNIDQSQKQFIDRCNLFVKAYKGEPLDKGGVCSGLSKLYIYYVKQNRKNEFEFFITFINSLNENDIFKLANDYNKNPNLRVGLDRFNEISYPFKKLLDFIEAIRLVQKTQFTTKFKSIKADFDAYNIIDISKTDEFSEHLKKCNVMQCKKDKEEQQFKFISTGNHLMALTITKEGAFFYDPNSKTKSPLCKDETVLASAITDATNKIERVTGTKIKAIDIFDVSYGAL
ncbi:MAG: hypothetical protein KIT56_09995 [Gammaproteobacteria bacterium]|nr:hypothetical protein [Gammaproteobacteria bacterium]MCW5584181.1 hypothetical protein [Gammaproteobacteria bacterium]